PAAGLVDVSLREESGMGAGGRTIVEDAAAAALVALSRLGSAPAGCGSPGLGSASFGSAGFGSAGFGSSSDASASTGRGRGNGLAGANAAAGIATTEPNHGDGLRPPRRK